MSTYITIYWSILLCETSFKTYILTVYSTDLMIILIKDILSVLYS